MVLDLFRSRAALEAEIWTLRQQINVPRRTAPKRQTFSAIDRSIFVCLYRLRPGVRDALAIVKPETVVKWHRAGFRLFWRWKSRARGGRPAVPLEIRNVIREMSIERQDTTNVQDGVMTKLQAPERTRVGSAIFLSASP
jgi:hypothetical protein